MISFGFQPTTHPTLESAFSLEFPSTSGVASIYLGTHNLSNPPFFGCHLNVWPIIMLSNSSITGERGAETPCPTLTSFLRHATKVADNPFNPASSTGTPPDCINSDSKRDPPPIPIYSDGAPLVTVVRNDTIGKLAVGRSPDVQPDNSQ